jgi:hypothetical protein
MKGVINIAIKKSNQILVAIGLFMLSAIALIFTIGLVLLPDGDGMVTSPILGTYHIGLPSFDSPVADALVYILLPIPFILTFEGALWRLHEALGMRREVLKYKPKTIWSAFATFNQVKDILNAVIFLSVFIILIALLLYELWYFPKVISKNTVLYAATVIAYAAIRKKLGKAWNHAAKRFRSGLPTYRLVEDGVMIRLFPNAGKRFSELQPVHIRFDEIDELQVMTYTESEAFLKYNIGPDFQLSKRQLEDTAAYLRGKIPRPSVYTYGGAKNDCVLIRGKELFYMISFDADSVSDLTEAYRSFKNSSKEAGPGNGYSPQCT